MFLDYRLVNTDAIMWENEDYVFFIFFFQVTWGT